MTGGKTCVFFILFFFFFSSRRRHKRFTSGWSSDVCSSDLEIWSAEDCSLTKHMFKDIVSLRLSVLQMSINTNAAFFL